MSSKRVLKKSSRYADFFEPEEINCKRKRKDDGDDDEFDDDMVPVPKDLADVLKRKQRNRIQRSIARGKRKMMAMTMNLTMIWFLSPKT